MKIYVFEPNGGYCGGCCIVAANSPLEAYGVLSNKSSFYAEYTDIKHCSEMVSLQPDESIKEPTLIIDKFYIE